MTLLAPTLDVPTAVRESAVVAAAQAERIAQSAAAKPTPRRVRMPAALERLECAARAEVQAMRNPRRSCSEEDLLFATVAWDLGLDGAAVGVSGR
ncbi:hypothetical protein [Xanthomonas hortorum]|uniref:Uncharacterized protein n=1 Tax=Xanthomonas hortorum pv. hederae TaxID=453603 RepID=A0A9X4BRD6_9XANT|nr:hypothetical protein [Xanthomonas hortorum]KQQ75760.1 hypothetical protein ASF73_08230 [Xanthomonas sp. Leaf131]MCE4371189.1 hypothetical protein [Xanthomonas hortorum pv. hederae]MDC8638208.1 hypothetical protein [Xanthomonas hortorum pv. hederae]PPU85952.1 hypothetical protein XhhCFBP4925_01865 [Xanthomonas hortorum pv. hederae]PUE99664.1 hypothetical protein C7T87_12815 [Xanthomonas hortorum pv. hederae]